ncbi:PilN domain-containing protein [Pectinatus frisingensis]|uniref:PilN domain-containing protein n=1 Tax=Pectinatus frisingensis TaxID=865 RepID=UPI0018C613AE|nr:PilN domain-containing protein [Pectinatus frisingensis]
MNNQTFKTLLYTQHADIITLTIENDNVYLAQLSLSENIWTIKNIEHCITNSPLNSDDFIDQLKNKTTKFPNNKLPLYITLPSYDITVYNSIFPIMPVNELTKAVYWDIQGNPSIDIDQQYAVYRQTPAENSWSVDIYTINKAIISTWQSIATRLNLKLTGIFPCQENQCFFPAADEFSLSINNQSVIFNLPSGHNNALPEYLTSLAQNAILKDTQLNFLPDKLRPSTLNWSILFPVTACLAVISALSLLVLLHLNIADAQHQSKQQIIQLQNMANLSEQKKSLELYQQNIVQRKSILLTLKPQHMSCYSLLSNLGSVTPDFVWLDSITTDETGDILLNGSSYDYPSLQNYIIALQEHYFPTIDLVSVSNHDTDDTVLTFTLKIFFSR